MCNFNNTHVIGVFGVHSFECSVIDLLVGGPPDLESTAQFWRSILANVVVLGSGRKRTHPIKTHVEECLQH